MIRMTLSLTLVLMGLFPPEWATSPARVGFVIAGTLVWMMFRGSE